MMKSLLLFFSLLALCPAQTLDTLIETAKEHNPSLAASGYEAEAKGEAAHLSGRLENPKLTVGVNDILSSDPYARDQEPMQTQSVTLSQKFPLSSRLKKAERMAAAHADVSRLILDKKTISLVYNIKQAVYRLKKLESDLDIIGRYQTILDKMIAVHTLYNIETRTHYQMALTTEILKKELEVRRTRTVSAIAVVKARLQRLVAVPVASVEYQLKLPPLPSLNRLKEEAPGNIDWRIKMQELEASQEGVAYAKTARIPDITVGAGYFQRDAFDDYYAVSVTIPLTLYERENIALAKSMKERDAVNEALADMKNNIAYELEEAYFNIKRAREEYGLLQSIIAARRDITESLIARIESKQSSLREGYDVIKDTFESEFQLNAALLEANLYAAAAQMLTGATR